MSRRLSTRDLRSTPEDRLCSKLRRDELAAAGVCINGASHGPRTHGVRCYRCSLVHKYGVRRAELILDVAARMTPPGKAA